MIKEMFGKIFGLSDKNAPSDKDSIMSDNVKKELPRLTTQQLAKIKVKRQFEISIEEADWDQCDQNGNPTWRRVNMGHESGRPVVISVSSPQELQELRQQYKLADQRFNIVREIDPPPYEKLYELAVQQGVVDGTVPAEQVVQPKAENSAVSENNVISTVREPAGAGNNINYEQPKKNIKIITVGNIQLKYDGDNVYQKQWITLPPDEASNYRVVSDTSNKVVSLTGKHIEAKRWIKVENSSTDEGDSDAE